MTAARRSATSSRAAPVSAVSVSVLCASPRGLHSTLYSFALFPFGPVAIAARQIRLCYAINTKYIINHRITNKDAQAITNELLPDDDTLG